MPVLTFEAASSGSTLTDPAAGYLVSDVKGDGITDTADMTIVDNNAAGYAGAATP